jgi:hypothetical protein
MTVEPGHYFVSPYYFVKYAEDFLAASKSRNSTAGFSPVEYYLACHSVELSLKAFMLLKGVSKDEICKKPFGHNLVNILDKCLKLELEELVAINNSEISLIEKLNEWYFRKGFEYFDVKNIASGAGNLPDVKYAQELALHLVERLKGPCGDEANKP